MRGLIVVAMALLGGCAATGPTWYKQGATQASFDADKAECRYEAIKYGGAFDPSFGKSYAVAMQRNDITIACLRQKGYSQQQGPVKQEPFVHVPVDLHTNGKKTRLN